MCSRKLKIENILNGIFILLPGSCPSCGAGESKTLAWGFAMAPILVYSCRYADILKVFPMIRLWALLIPGCDHFSIPGA